MTKNLSDSEIRKKMLKRKWVLKLYPESVRLMDDILLLCNQRDEARKERLKEEIKSGIEEREWDAGWIEALNLTLDLIDQAFEKKEGDK